MFRLVFLDIRHENVLLLTEINVIFIYTDRWLLFYGITDFQIIDLNWRENLFWVFNILRLYIYVIVDLEAPSIA